jgi:hypothetical protein
MLPYFFLATNDSGYNNILFLKMKFGRTACILTQIKDPGGIRPGPLALVSLVEGEDKNFYFWASAKVSSLSAVRFTQIQYNFDTFQYRFFSGNLRVTFLTN